jgi:hypothetical protein
LRLRLLIFLHAILISNCLPALKNTKINYYFIPNKSFSEEALIHEDSLCTWYIPLSANGVKKELLVDLYKEYSNYYNSNKIIIVSEKKYEWICNHYYKIRVYKDE